MTQAAHQLAFHGAIVLLFALLLGAPYAKAIKSNAPLEVVNSWRVAHQSLSLGAALLFALAAVLPILVKSQLVAWSVAFASSLRLALSAFLRRLRRSLETEASLLPGPAWLDLSTSAMWSAPQARSSAQSSSCLVPPRLSFDVNVRQGAIDVRHIACGHN